MSARQPGPTASLALALFHRWEPERLFVIVSVYIDESGTHGSGLTILGGWVGRLGQWATFDPKWVKLLKRNGLTYFHSKKMRGTKDEFKGWTRERKFGFTQQAASLALKNLEFGFTISVIDKAYQDHYVAGNRPREIPLDSRYGLCFRYCLSLIPGFAKDVFKGRDLDINFILESGHNNAGDAERIFNRVKKQGLTNPAEVEIVRMLNVISFADKMRFPGLQITDVNAYSAFQHYTREPLELVTLNPETSMQDAKHIQKVPIFNLELRETELKQFKQFILAEIEDKKARQKKPMLSSFSSGGQSS
ncbi:MAG: DUF3800 domain-containing protein [Xanthobacteraceae bacterium]